VLSLWNTLSDERSGLSPVSHCRHFLVHFQRVNIIYIVHVTCFKYMQNILDLCQHRLSTAEHATIYATTASRRLIGRTLDRAKFKPLMFSLELYCWSSGVFSLELYCWSSGVISPKTCQCHFIYSLGRHNRIQQHYCMVTLA
jgi:hypothetical protein